MNRFDEILKAKLDSHEAPLDMEMWNSIEQGLEAPASPSSSFNASLVGGIAATTVMLLLFTSLPTLKHSDKTVSVVTEQAENKEVTFELKTEALPATFEEQESHKIELKHVEVALTEVDAEEPMADVNTTERQASGNDVVEHNEDDIVVEITADFSASGIQCPGSEITFNALKTEGSVTWLFDGIHVEEGSSASHLFAVSGEHEVVMMTEINGKSVSVKKSIEIYEAPNFRVFSVIEKSTDCLTSDVLLSTEPSEYAYEWSLNSQLGDGDEMSYALLAGTYMATVKGISSAGCIGIVNHPVLVKDESGIYIPNSFAPDGDGLNDIWKPIGLLDDHSHELSIFTVPGQELVYHSTEIIEWNGSLNGQDMPARKNYLYQLKVTDACGNTETKSGTITTIR